MVRLPSFYALPALTGIFLFISFPLPNAGFAAWFALVPLLVSLRSAMPSSGFKAGFVAGLVFYIPSIYWVAGTMSGYGGLPYPVAILLLVALSAYMSLYIGAFGWLAAATGQDGRVPVVMAAPVYWTALELARNYMLSGFPWDQLGYSQASYPLVIQAADVTGVYGISAAVVLVNAALAELFSGLREKGRALRSGLAGAILAACVLAALIGYGMARLANPPVAEGSLTVALIQGNIEQFAKWDPAYQDEVFDTYAGLTRGAAESGPDLIVWPETATPFYFQDDSNRARLEELAVETGTYILTGSPSFEDTGGGSITDYNSAFLISPEGITAGRYDKVHLVPFGEYVPLGRFLPFVSKMVTAIGDFGTGRGCTVIHLPDGTFGTAICFEVIFPELVRQFAQGGADFLVNITNDAWFGRSAAPYQHFNMAVFRAVENRRALVRAANTGISGVITPDGMVSARTDIFTRGYVMREIPLVRETTFYTRHGDLFAYACSAAGLVFLVLILVRRMYNRKAEPPSKQPRGKAAIIPTATGETHDGSGRASART